MVLPHFYHKTYALCGKARFLLHRRHAHVLHLGHHLGLAERDVKEELQPRDGGVDRHRTSARVHQVQLEAPKVLGGGGIGRAAEECGQLANGADVAVLRVLGKLAHAHVVEHAMAEGAQFRPVLWVKRHFRLIVHADRARVCRGLI